MGVAGGRPTFSGMLDCCCASQPPAAPIRVLLIDDSPAYLEALGTMLASRPEIQVVGRAETAERGLELVRELRPDVVLLDLMLPDIHGLDVAAELAASHPTVRIVMLTSHDSPAYREAARAVGGRFVHKERAVSELLPAVQELAGRRVDPEPPRPRPQIHLLPCVVDAGPDARFCQIAEIIEEVFWLTDVAKNRVIYVSPAYARIWGRSCESLYAEPRSWLDAIHPADRERVLDAALRRQAEGGYDVDYRIVRPDGAVRWIHDRAYPVRDDDGVVRRIAGVAADVTDRRQLEQRLEESQTQEALGRLAVSIAHDFNNLLAVIQLQASALAGDPTLPTALVEEVSEILEAARGAAGLSRQLLTFGVRQLAPAPEERATLDVAEATTRFVAMFRRLLGELVTVECRAAPELPMVRASLETLDQILMNLLVNARDAMPSGGTIRVTADVVAADALKRPDHAADAARFVRLCVADDGTGIAPEHVARVFEPFFTTKDAGKGTGLGLATVTEIAKSHGGWVDVRSTLGAGTDFCVYLPAVESGG